MGTRLTLETIIRAVFKGTGAKDAADGLDNASKAAKKTGKESKKAGLEVDKLGNKLKSMVGGALLLRFVKGAVQEFAKFERALKATETELTRLGISAEEQMPRIKSFLDQLERGPGILRQDALPQFNKFLGILKDTDAAMLAVKVASGAAQGGYKDFGTAAALFGSLLQGEVIEPAKSLGIAVFDSAGEVRDLGDVLDETIDKFVELNKAQGDTQSDLDAGVAAWNEFKMAVGEGLKVLAGTAGALRFVLKVLKSLGPVTLAAASSLIGIWKGVATFFQEFSLKKLLLGDIGNLKQAFASALKEGMSSAIFAAEGARDVLVDIWAKTGEQEGINEAEARDKIIEVAQRARIKKNAAAARQAARLAEQQAKAVADIELRAELDLLRARLQAARGNATERLKIELELLDRQRKAAIAAARAKGASVAAIEQAFDLARRGLVEDAALSDADRELQLKQELLNADLELEQAHLDSLSDLRVDDLDRRRELEIERMALAEEQEIEAAERTGKSVEGVRAKWRKKRKAAEIKHGKTINAIGEQVAQTAKEQAFAIANQAVALGRAVFGQNKAFAVAETVIRTIMGVSSALALYPPNIPLAALIAATGAAGVIKILSTEPGSASLGGPPPLGSAAAAVGTGAGAGRPVGIIGAAPPPTFAEPAPDQQVDNSQTINIGNVYGGQAGLRQLRRELDRAKRNDLRLIE